MKPKAVICSPSARDGEVDASEYGELAQVKSAVFSPATADPRSLIWFPYVKLQSAGIGSGS